MRSKANTSSDSSPPEHPCRADIGKLILEGMMTVFIVLMFLFIAQNWVLTNVGATLFTPTCTDGGVGIGEPAPYETNNIIGGYKLVLQ